MNPRLPRLPAGASEDEDRLVEDPPQLGIVGARPGEEGERPLPAQLAERGGERPAG